MPDKYPWQKWCNVCEEWVANKKQHYIDNHPELLWHRVKRKKMNYYQEIKDCHEAGDLTILMDLEWVLIFRVPVGITEDYILSDGKKIKVGTFYECHEDDGVWKEKETEEEEE